MTGALRSGQLARAAGVNPETLRYYERRGVLPAPDRTLGGHRVYPAETVTVLRVIKATQRLGFTLEEVAELLRSGQHRHGARPERGLQSRVAAKLAEVDQKIDALRVIRAALVEASEAGCDDVIACAASDCCPLPFAELGVNPLSVTPVPSVDERIRCR